MINSAKLYPFIVMTVLVRRWRVSVGESADDYALCILFAMVWTESGAEKHYRP
jgi:hypothetical protein